LSHEAEVGVKWNVQRGWRTSHRRTAGCLWAASVAATLGVYIIIQGISVLLRPYPDGSIDSDVIATIQASVGSIPIAFIVVIALAIALDVALRTTRWGLSIRAVGSNAQAAAKLGVRTNRTVL
jgi:ribose transport system ATP-binding protein